MCTFFCINFFLLSGKRQVIENVTNSISKRSPPISTCNQQMTKKCTETKISKKKYVTIWVPVSLQSETLRGMRDKPIEISWGSEGSLRVAIPSPRQDELKAREPRLCFSWGGRGGYGYTWANPWRDHVSRRTHKTLTIRRGSRVFNDEYAAAVRQRTVRQETAMAKHGTLPEFLYQRHLEVGDQVTGHT